MGKELIKEVLSLLDLDHSDYKLIGGYNNNVFEVGRNKKIIIKILEDCVVSELKSLAESEWLDFLLSRGVKTAYIFTKPIMRYGEHHCLKDGARQWDISTLLQKHIQLTMRSLVGMKIKFYSSLNQLSYPRS